MDDGFEAITLDGFEGVAADRAEAFFARWGSLAVLVCRLLPVVRGGHPLLLGPSGRARRGPRSLKALLGWPWIGPLPDTPARAAFERAFVTMGLKPPEVQLQANSPSVMRAVLHNGDAVALVSPLQIRADIAAGTLVVLPVPVSGTERAIGVSLRRGGLASSVCQALLQDLQAVSASGRS